MSAGQIIGGIVGAVVGFFAGGNVYQGAVIGAQLGAAVGGMIDPPRGPHIIGPRLTDLTTQTSTYGAVIPRIFGTVPIVGNVFWLENNQLKETENTQSQGKGGGGPETTTFTYSATFAVGLCEGPIVGVRRIWIGANLIYDAGANDLSSIIASNLTVPLFKIYTGADTQQPDPRMQSTLGVANTPAYRGLAYIVFYDLPLKDYQNSLVGAQVKVEVVASGSIGWVVTPTSLPVSAGWGAIASARYGFCALSQVSGTPYAMTSPDGVIWTQRTMPTLPAGVAWSAIAGNDRGYCAISQNYSDVGAVSTDGISWTATSLPPPVPYLGLATGAWFSVDWNGNTYCAVGSAGAVATSEDGVTWARGAVPTSQNIVAITHIGILFCAISATNAFVSNDDGITWTQATLPSGSWNLISAVNGKFVVVGIAGTNIVAASSDGATWTAGTLPTVAGWTALSTSGTDLCLLASDKNVAYTSKDGMSWTTIALASAFQRGIGWNGGIFVALTDGNIGTTLRPDSLTVNTVPLSSIVSTECLKSNLLTSADIDITALTSAVRGYTISSVAAIRGGFDPLIGAWPFDVIQSGYKIKFTPRGGSSVVTIPVAKLDARSVSGQPGVQITNAREMDSVLPSKVALKYFDSDREYNTGEQYAERLNTQSVNIRAMDLAIVLTADEAAQKAEILLYLYWLERYDVSFNLPPEYNNLEPADVITIVTADASYQLRLAQINYTSDGRLECQVKYNNAATYTSTASGGVGASTGQVLTLTGPSQYELLDVPLLKDVFDTAGFPVAMSGYLSGWPGGILMRSDDVGQTWAQVQGFLKPGSTMGYAANSLGAHNGRMIDKASVLQARVNQALSSVTELQMLNGSNHFAYGLDGRWEIIAAQNCVLQSDGSYVLTDLLRGRFGSEWATGLHAANDHLVLLNTASLQFVTNNLNVIGMARTYRGITTGKTLDSDSNRTMTYNAVNLKCLSPVYLNGNRNPSTNDWTLTWIRRTRKGGELRDLVDAQLSEASESYSIDIFSDGTYATVKRTLAATTQTTAYTSAQQVADFGGNQATLYVKVYQISATTGRGYPLTVSITR